LGPIVSINSGEFSTIDRHYLGVTNIPVFLDSNGDVLLDPAWRHDLVQHLAYLPTFVLAAPVRPRPSDRTDLVPLGPEYQDRLQIIRLPAQASRMGALADLPKTALALWRAVGRADIVHSGIAGWPYPLGWLAFPMARLRGKKTLIIVESAPWRNLANGTLTKRIEAAVYEALGRWSCRLADLSFYTQPSYRAQFHARGRGPAFVAPAAWVNEEDILEDGQAAVAWDEKMARPVRFVYAGRLVAEKGLEVLLEAAQKLSKLGLPGTLHVVGDGPLRSAVTAAADIGPFTVRHFEPIAHGKPFLDFLQSYHVVVIPSLSDEQPRIVFDAAARAVAVLASDTDGLRPHVEHRRTGFLVPPGDASALAEAMAEMADAPGLLRDMAALALRRVRQYTHRSMHAERSRLLALHLL
jgi:glycosyltransferase involved in cell wall biosynthesis